jgi:uncharacterized protein YqjF (DUF2071 family)
MLTEETHQLIAAQQRPNRIPVMHQRWDNLFFLHWEVAPHEVERILPSGLVVDTFDGKAHVGIVGFQMNGIRPSFLPPLPWLSYFNELNVRVYVKDKHGAPGVFFLSLDCDRLPAVHIARTCFSLPYYHAEMRFSRDHETNSLTCRRRETSSTTRDTAQYSWRPNGAPAPTTPGTLEFHLVERYTFFTLRRQRLLCGRVHHAPYQISPAIIETWGTHPLQWDSFPIPADSPPQLAHCSPGVRVEAFGLTE